MKISLFSDSASSAPLCFVSFLLLLLTACNSTTANTPEIRNPIRTQPLSPQFYYGKTFPEKYRNGAFVAFRGSWNRNAGTGYKIVFVPFNSQGRPLGYYKEFLTGFLVDPSGPTTWGGPVGLLVLPDGSLLLTEEANNRIYRIQYRG